MSSFEVLYGRKWQTLLFWNEPGENQVFGPEILWEAEGQVQVVRENLHLAQSRQKKLRRSKKEIKFQSRWFCVPKSVTHERTSPFQDTRKACTKIYWTIQDSRAKRRSSLSAWATTSVIGCVWCFSCFTTKEVFVSSGRTYAFGRINNWWRSYISRIPGKIFGHFRESLPE
jgi:hypothetical protein